MKPYGMTRMQKGDTDVAGCIGNGRATAVYALNGRAYRSLRHGKKKAARRIIKRQARNQAKKEIIGLRGTN